MKETFIYAAHDRGRLVYASVPVEADLYRFWLIFFTIERMATEREVR